MQITDTYCSANLDILSSCPNLFVLFLLLRKYHFPVKCAHIAQLSGENFRYFIHITV